MIDLTQDTIRALTFKVTQYKPQPKLRLVQPQIKESATLSPIQILLTSIILYGVVVVSYVWGL